MDTLTTAPVVTGSTIENVVLFHKAKHRLRQPERECDIVGFDFREDEPILIESFNPGSGEWERHWVRAEQLLPMLRPFSALCEPLEDGTVPMVEMAKINWPHRDTVKATLHKPGEVHLWEKVDFPTNNDERLARYIYLYESDFLHSLALSWKAADYLRRHHFAIGLSPEQYIAK